jgi:hypothetical protein
MVRRLDMEKKRVTLYLPMEDEVKRWQELSKAAGSPSLSKWVQEMVQIAIENKENPRPKSRVRSGFNPQGRDFYTPAREFTQDLYNKMLVEKTKMLAEKEKQLEKTQMALKKFETCNSYEQLEKAVIATFLKRSTWKSNKLVAELKIDNEESLMLLNRVLQNLEDIGAITEVGGLLKCEKQKVAIKS